MNNAAINVRHMPLCRQVFITFGYIPRSGIAKLQDTFMLNFLRKLSNLQSAYTILHYHQ